MEEELRGRLGAVGAFAEALEAPGFVPGRWHPSVPLVEEPDTRSMPWYELSEPAEAFVRVLGGILEPFDVGRGLGQGRLARSVLSGAET